MKIKFANSNIEGKLLEGEYLRYANEKYGEYLCVGIFNTNRILFQYIDIANESVDFVQSVVDNVPDFAMNYLEGVLSDKTDVLVRMIFYPGTPTSFEIYYDCYCEEDDVENLISWIASHNDFAAEEYKYTEIIDGHQMCIGS